MNDEKIMRYFVDIKPENNRYLVVLKRVMDAAEEFEVYYSDGTFTLSSGYVLKESESKKLFAWRYRD